MWYRIFSGFTANSVYFSGNESVALLFVVLVLASVLYAVGRGKRRKLPPGPMGLPIFGYYPFLDKKPQRMLNEVGKKYGNVFSLYLGSQYVVFLNDWEALKDALGQNTTVDRPPSLFAAVPYNFGIVGANGEEWHEIRRLSSRAMKDGLHKNHWENLIAEEISEIIKCILQKGENPIEVRNFFRETLANQVVTLILGQRLPTGHPITTMVSKSVDAILEYTPTFAMINFSPKLTKVLQILGLDMDYFLLAKKIQDFSDFVSNTVDERIEKFNSEVEDSFIERFHKEVENKRKNKIKTYITEKNLKGTVIGLLTGGSETTRTTIIWALMAMAEHPDIQSKVHEELDSAVGRASSIRWSNRSKIPFTYACLMESMRWKTTIPFPAMRIATEDIQVQGYHIPKGTFIVTNNWSIHNDPKYWPDPEQFIPERFLLEDGKKVNAAPESFNPFSFGKRQCPGRLLAFMGTLQYFATLMQNFKVMPKEGDKVKYDGALGLSYQAHGVELRFIPR